MKLTVIGAGAWGTAMALNAVRRHAVTLWGRDAAQMAQMRKARQNARYLPGIALPDQLQLASGPLSALDAQLQASDLVVLATPIAGVRQVLGQLQDLRVPVAWLCKGFEPALPGEVGRMVHEICAAVAPRLLSGVLSGPSFALEVAREQPTALVAASAHAAVQGTLVEAFHCNSLRVYVNDDVVGVEVGGAVKNVLAIATGLCDGLQLGLNARAALITRGLAEMTRLGLALGARADTFMGLSGLGDLVLTATGDLSRNRKVGLLLAQGLSLSDAVQSLGHVAEGVYCARTVIQRAEQLGVSMPIASAVGALLDGRLDATEVMRSLMGRSATAESPLH